MAGWVVDLALGAIGTEARERFAAVIVSSDTQGAAAAEAVEAVDLAGGRVLRRIGLSDLPRDLAHLSSPAILLIEAIGADAELLSDALPRLAAAAALLDLQTVVSLEIGQVDQIGRELLGGGVQLLCRPSLAERVAALTLAASAGERVRLHDSMREGEAARLARLNAEVARIAEVLARLSRRDPVSSFADDRRTTFESGPTDAPIAITAIEVRQAIRARRLRDRFFGEGLFEDPAWDMILDLFAAHLERSEVSVSSLCIAAAVAPTTALRWIGRMTDAGLFERHPDPFDRRRALMTLSPRTIEGLRGYVGALQAHGVPFS